MLQIIILLALFAIGLVVVKMGDLKKVTGQHPHGENFPFPTMPYMGSAEQDDGDSIGEIRSQGTEFRYGQDDPELGFEPLSPEAQIEGGAKSQEEKRMIAFAAIRPMAQSTFDEEIAQDAAPVVPVKENGDAVQSGESALNRMMRDFTIDKAVVYAEILKPKYEQY